MRAFTALLATLVASCASAPTADDPALLESVEALVEDFDGDVGVYVRHLPSGTELALDADETYPTASLVKVPILLALFERIEAGELDLHASLEYSEERSRGGEDLLASFKDGAKIHLNKLIHLMIAFSDNTASVWCQELAGRGEGVNAWLEGHGFDGTRVNSRTTGREDAYREWGWGQTTPREMCDMLALIRGGQAVSPRASEEMDRVLCRTYWDSEGVSAVPPYAQAATKQGAVNRSRSEVLLVGSPSGDYVFCVITKNQTDTSWGADNEGFVLLRDVSRVLWEHFGGDGWTPAPGVAEWQ
ncbi:MAG: serine hydrolase [Planctomycetota bacterium]